MNEIIAQVSSVDTTYYIALGCLIVLWVFHRLGYRAGYERGYDLGLDRGSIDATKAVLTAREKEKSKIE